MALTVIEPTPGLSGADRRRAHRAGPPAVAVRTSYQSLLATARFVDIGHRDATAEYRTTLTAWLDALEHRSEAIARIMGPEAHDERLANGASARNAIDDGLLSRSVYWATRA